MSNTDLNHFRNPVHHSLTPRELQFLEAPIPSWLKTAISDIKIHSCRTLLGSVSYRYFQLQTNSGPLFAKVKEADSARIESHAALLSSQLKELGVPTSNLVRDPINLENGNSLFLYQWVDHNFYKPCRESIENFSDNLAKLHHAMSSIDYPQDESIHNIFKQNIDKLSTSSLANESEEAFNKFTEIYIRSPKQLTHNDLHIANILFQENKVCAFIDFEDSLRTSSIIHIDIAASLERFILTSEHPNMWRIFLNHYTKTAQLKTNLQLQDVIIAGQARCYNSLGILSKTPEPNNKNWKYEWNKFIYLLKLWEEFKLSQSFTNN